MPRRTEAALLAELEAIAARHRALADELQAVQSRRDLLIFALYRRKASLRKIAAAAGLHYTRIRQITKDADDVSSSAGLAKMHPKKRKRAAKTAPRRDATETPPDAP